MVTLNKTISDLCTACGVEHDPTKRITERRGLELIRECTEKVKVLTMGTATLATALTEKPAKVLLPVEEPGVSEAFPEPPKQAIKTPKLGK